MAIEPITIVLTPDLAGLAEALVEAQQVAKATFADAFVSSVEKATTKLSDLTKGIQNNTAVIEANKTKVNELERQRQGANTAELQRINSEITALQKLSQQRQLDTSKLEEKKTKVAALLAASQTQSEQERLGIQLTTQQRLIEIGTLRDQQRALDSVRETATRSSDRIGAKLDEITSKQFSHQIAINATKAKIEELHKAHESATEASRAEIEQEISSLTRAIGLREREQLTMEEKNVKLKQEQALLHATSDVERQQIQNVSQARMGDLAAQKDQIRAQQQVKDTFTETTDEQIAEIDALTAKKKQEQAVIEKDKALLDELRNKRNQASGEERKALDQQIEALKKAIGARENEIYTIDRKILKLQEMMKLAVAGSEQERDAIRAATQERLIELEAIRDEATAVRNVREETEAGANSVERYIKGWFGIQGVMAVVREVTELVKAQVQVIEDLNKGLDTVQKNAEHFHDAFSSMNTEFGLTDQAGQAAAAQVLSNVSTQMTREGKGAVTPTQLSESYAALGPAFNDPNNRIAYDSSQGQDLAANASILAQRGLDKGNVGNLARNLLHDNKGLTGDQLNQSASNLMATVGGPKAANAFLSSWHQNQQKFTQVGLSLTDAQQMFASAMASGSSPEESANLINRYAQGADRLIHISNDKEALDEYHKIRNLNPQQEESFRAM
ncbi:MAG: hypothetical protein JWP44_4132, partial [Mucilaginibacter sp.]|nr:hypothetical protein [Mucilaginibacter sp.]